MCSCMLSRLHWPQSSISSHMLMHGKLAKAKAFLVVPSAWLWAPQCWSGPSYCWGTNHRFAVYINQLCILSWTVYVYLVIFILFDSCHKFYTTCITDFLWHNWRHWPLSPKLFHDNGEEVFCHSLLLICLKKCSLLLFQPCLLFISCPLSMSHIQAVQSYVRVMGKSAYVTTIYVNIYGLMLTCLSTEFYLFLPPPTNFPFLLLTSTEDSLTVGHSHLPLFLSQFLDRYCSWITSAFNWNGGETTSSQLAHQAESQWMTSSRWFTKFQFEYFTGIWQFEYFTGFRCCYWCTCPHVHPSCPPLWHRSSPPPPWPPFTIQRGSGWESPSH